MDLCSHLFSTDPHAGKSEKCVHAGPVARQTRSRVTLQGCSQCGGPVCSLCQPPRSRQTCCNKKICDRCAEGVPRCGLCKGALCNCQVSEEVDSQGAANQ